MQKDVFRELLDGYISNTLTDSELNTFLEACKDNANQQIVQEQIQALLEDGTIEGFSDKERADSIFNNIMDAARVRRIHRTGTSGMYFWMRFAAAAIIILGISLIGYKYLNKNNEPAVAFKSLEPQEKRFKNDILPSHEQTVLQLADGRKVLLDSTIGTITKEGGATVINLKGELNYQQGKARKEEIVYHTIYTGRGDQYALVLPDGSKVWLNTLSSLRFPTAFVGKERNVVVTGEAHFEIAHNASRPFKVAIASAASENSSLRQLEKGTVEVLGTSFNINAYDDEATVRTTLLKGSVKVSRNGESMTIQPGKQVKIENDKLVLVDNPDLVETMAWKNGLFHFENSDIRTIMRNLARWYDIEVEYKSELPYLFVANIPREVPISKLLKYLELTELVHFRIEGRKITVLE